MRLRLRVALDKPRREIAPAGVKRDREADREPEEDKHAGRRPCLDPVGPALEEEPQGGGIPRQRPHYRGPEIGTQDPRGALQERAGEGGAAAVARLGRDLLGLNQDGAREPQRLVELAERGLSLGPVALDVGALLRRVLLRPRAELVEPCLGGVDPRLELVDDVPDALPERFGLLADALEVLIAKVAAERCVLLGELGLERLEPAAQRPGFVAQGERRRLLRSGVRGRRRRRGGLRRGRGACRLRCGRRGGTRQEHARQSKAEKEVAHGLAPHRLGAARVARDIVAERSRLRADHSVRGSGERTGAALSTKKKGGKAALRLLEALGRYRFCGWSSEPPGGPDCLVEPVVSLSRSG